MFSVTEKAVNRMLLRSCEIASPGKSDFLSLRPDNHDTFSLTMWQGNGGADQRFVFVPVDETYHRILTLRKDAADRPFLGVERQSGGVVVGPHSNDGSQLFRVIDQDEGYFSIAACLAGCGYLDSADGTGNVRFRAGATGGAPRRSQLFHVINDHCLDYTSAMLVETGSKPRAFKLLECINVVVEAEQSVFLLQALSLEQLERLARALITDPGFRALVQDVGQQGYLSARQAEATELLQNAKQIVKKHLGLNMDHTPPSIGGIVAIMAVTCALMPLRISTEEKSVVETVVGTLGLVSAVLKVVSLLGIGGALWFIEIMWTE